jgi:hypothetical protein
MGLESLSQEKTKRNYISCSTLYDASNASIGLAAEYERWLKVKKKFVLGAKVNYVFPHKTFNLFWPPEELFKSNQQLHVMANGYYFPGKRNDQTGFFIALAAGVNYVKGERRFQEGNAEPKTIKNSRIGFGHDFSMGIQFKFNDRAAWRLSGGIANFYSKKEETFPEFLPIVLIFTKLSIGF